MKTRWVGIDEAGYGPKLGPLTMVAVVAEGIGDGIDRPDLWVDLKANVARAGSKGGEHKLWVDDSKRLYSRSAGIGRLEAATFALLQAARRDPPARLSELLEALGAGDFAHVELDPWLLERDPDPRIPKAESQELISRAGVGAFEEAGDWRIVDVRANVVGPARFNRASKEVRAA